MPFPLGNTERIAMTTRTFARYEYFLRRRIEWGNLTGKS
jgi:hypothetical protein